MELTVLKNMQTTQVEFILHKLRRRSALFCAYSINFIAKSTIELAQKQTISLEM